MTNSARPFDIRFAAASLALLAVGAFAQAPAPAPAKPPSPPATAAPVPLPNVVAISERLVTAGQPGAPALATLAALGFQAVINLTPPGAANTVRDESAILERQGIVYIDIPVDLDNPTQGDFDTFVGAMAAMGTRKVLVHCQANMRASSFVFLYRSIILKESPGPSYEAVTRVWSPTPRWKQFMQGQLRTHGVAFDAK